MYTVYNGKLINNLQDVLDVLRDTLGNEFAEVTENIVSNVVSNAYDSAYDSTITTMSDQLDAVNEAWATVVRDTRDEIDAILSKPRIDRKALRCLWNNLDAEL